MKRVGHVFEQIAERENLRRALGLALCGRRQRGQLRWTTSHLDTWIERLRRDISSGQIEVGSFQRFVIHDPKRRVIHAAAFRERVLHHAIMNVVGPAFERLAIDDSYACRLGKGAHRARARAQVFCAEHAHFLKLDVERYFDSIAHAVVLEGLERLFKDRRLLMLLGRIVGSYQTTPGRGLPIGSLVSQYLANAYLSPLDRLAKQQLGAKGYLRYMDDFILWHERVEVLESWRGAIVDFAGAALQLRLKDKQLLGRCRDGLPFLGARVTARAIYPSRHSRRRLRYKLRAYQLQQRLGELTTLELQRRTSALLGAVAQTRCLSWRRRELVSSASEV